MVLHFRPHTPLKQFIYSQKVSVCTGRLICSPQKFYLLPSQANRYYLLFTSTSFAYMVNHIGLLQPFCFSYLVPYLNQSKVRLEAFHYNYASKKYHLDMTNIQRIVSSRRDSCLQQYLTCLFRHNLARRSHQKTVHFAWVYSIAILLRHSVLN